MVLRELDVACKYINTHGTAFNPVKIYLNVSTCTYVYVLVDLFIISKQFLLKSRI